MSPRLVKLEGRPDLVDQVYRSLLDAISEGSLAPGTRITQEDIADQLAVSRQPVLQALRMLKKDGFVLDAGPGPGSAAGSRGRGVIVAPLDLAWIAKVYQVRGALDALAARLAADQRFRVDPKLIEAGRKAAAGKQIKPMIEADLAFHNTIYSASGNPLIEQSAQLHWRHIRRGMGAALQQSRLRQAVWDEHEEIARSIASGDGELAARLMNAHGERASAHMTAQLGAARS